MFPPGDDPGWTVDVPGKCTGSHREHGTQVLTGSFSCALSRLRRRFSVFRYLSWRSRRWKSVIFPYLNVRCERSKSAEIAADWCVSLAMVAMEQSTPTTPSAHRREPNTTPRLRRRAKPRHPGHPAARAPSRSKFSNWRRLEVSVIGPTFISLATSHGLPCHFRCAMFHWPGCVFTAGGWT